MSQTVTLQPMAGQPDSQVNWQQREYLGISGAAWARMGVMAGLMVTLFWPNLRRLWLKTNPLTGEANWGHSFFVPVIGLYYLYLNRDALLKASVRPGWLGLPIMLGGLLFYAWAIWPGQNDFFKDFGMVITLFGVVALLCGWQVMKITWFPILFLACAIPWPGLVYSWVALPLQKMAATAAVVTLKMFGVDAARAGTKIFMGDFTAPRVLNVAEACAGLKSLMTFITVAAAVGFLSSRALWQKVLITLSAIPIAIFCNMMRVAGQGLLDHFTGNPALSEGFAHMFVGMVMMIPAFFLILLVAWVLDNLFVEVADRKRRLTPAGTAPATVSRAAQVAAPARTTPRPAAAPARPAAQPEAPAPAAASKPATAAPAAAGNNDLAEATRRMMAANSLRRRPAGAQQSGGNPGASSSNKSSTSGNTEGK